MKKFIAIFLFLANVTFFAQVVSISSIRENNSSGEPILSGQTFTVKGIVTAGNQFGNSGPASIQDSTAGISIYGSAFAGVVNVGDSVIITSKLTQYKGLTQLKAVAPTIISSNNKVEPEIVTLSDIANQAWDGVELYESKLVRVNGITIDGTGNFESGTSGKNYAISDSSGGLNLRIDESANTIVGTPIPSGKVDLIGVVSQYKYSAPYNSGYQILPRTIEDIVTEDVPIILTPIIAADISTSSFTVYFKTARNGNSEVRYGKTKGLELGSVLIDDDTTDHKVTISGLDEFTKYYFLATSTNDVGTSEANKIQSVITSSSNPEIGTINVYFNTPVDTTVAIPGNNANGDVYFPDKIISRINQAQYSIDIALYSFFGLPDVESAIIAAKNRGVKIRFVYHNRDIQTGAKALLDAGILMSQRPDGNGLMHNKFAVFDARDDDPANDWVWMGSWNWTSLELGWRNNVVEINDPALADTYTTEFEEMWGSNNDTPNPTNAKFGSSKTDNTTHTFTIGGIEIESYFSPSDKTESHIVNSVLTADSSVYFALLAFTSNPIYDAIEARHNNYYMNDGRGVIADANLNGSDFARLQTLFPGEIFDQSTGGKIHNKFGIVDGSSPTSNPMVITGSHNWSASANTKNDENTLIIHDIYIANQYVQAFKGIYNSVGGTTEFKVPVITSVDNYKSLPTSFLLEQNYPNPFNPTTVIAYSVPSDKRISKLVTLRVYDILGREITTLVNKSQNSGRYQVTFNASNLPSGTYFYRLTSGGFSMTKKFLLLK